MHSRQIREYYDQLSERYSALYGQEQSAKHHEVLLKFDVQRHNVIVDIGCGDGLLLSKIPGRSTIRIGIDFSGRMLERAKKTLGNCDLVRGDARHLPLREGAADFVCCISLLDKDSIDTMVSEASRIAKQDATLLLSTIHPETLPPEEYPGLIQRDRIKLSPRETLYLLSKPVWAYA